MGAVIRLDRSFGYVRELLAACPASEEALRDQDVPVITWKTDMSEDQLVH
jgi:hypothetical protein